MLREKTSVLREKKQACPTGGEELKRVSAGNNISVTNNTKKEKVLQNGEVEDTTKPESSSKLYDHTPKSTMFQKVKANPASQMTVPKREDMLSENTQPMVEPSKQTVPRTESVDGKQHSKKVEKTDKIKHNDIRSEMSSSLTEAEKALNFSKEKTVKSNTDTVKTENECVVKKDDSLPAVRDQEFPESRENSVHENRKIKQALDAPDQSAVQVVLPGQRTQEPLFPAVNVKDDIQSNEQQSIPLAQNVNFFSFLFITDEENNFFSSEQKVKPDSQPTKDKPNTQSDTQSQCILYIRSCSKT